MKLRLDAPRAAHRRPVPKTSAQSDQGEQAPAGKRRFKRWAAAVVLGAAGIGGYLAFQGPAEDAAVKSLVRTAPTATVAAVDPNEPGLVREAAPSAAQQCVDLLRKCSENLAAIPDLKAEFIKQERIDGALGEAQRTHMKVRREPLSAYLRWQTAPEGREVIWQQGAHDGMMLVQAGGWQKMLLPVLKLDPLGDRALANTRHPITEAGIWNMTAKLLAQAEAAVADPELTVTTSDVLLEGGQSCRSFTIDSPADSTTHLYRRLTIWIDPARQAPLGFQLFSRPQSGSEPVLEESYLYINLELNAGLTDLDFDPANPSYEFVRKPS